MTIELNLSLKDARDILSTGIESGISYWFNDECRNGELKRSKDWGSEDTSLWWYEKLSFDSDCMGKMAHYEVTPEIMIEKFDAWMTYCRKEMKWRFQEWMDAMDEDDLACHCDAEDADCIIQFCCFGEVVFG